MIKLTIHFSLDEFLASQTASRDNIAEQFTPPAEVIANLTGLANQLEVVRGLLGSVPMLISSGYRCPRVNDRVAGSSKASAHMLGFAADFTAPGFGDPIDICRRLAGTSRLEFDQIIFEYGSWCHFAVGPGARRQCLSKFSGDDHYYPGIVARPGAGV